MDVQGQRGSDDTGQSKQLQAIPTQSINPMIYKGKGVPIF
jgi:hypothetical protein